MEKKHIGYLVIVVFVLLIIILTATTDYEEEEDTLDVDVTEVANAFAYDYETDYGDQYYITTEDSTAAAKYGSGMGSGSVSYTLCESEEDAQALYDTQAAQYASKVETGSAKGGLVFTAYTEAGDFTDGSGYYGEASQYGFTSIHYCAYYLNMYVDISLVSFKTGTISGAPVEPVIQAAFDAIENPKEVTAATYANNFAMEESNATFTGENAYEVTVTDDSTAKATYAVSGGMITECGVTFVICDDADAAKEMYEDDESAYKNKVETGSPIPALTYSALDDKYDFTAGYGYYGESTTYGFSSVHYSGYIGNVYFTAVYYSESTPFPTTDFGSVMGTVATAIAC